MLELTPNKKVWACRFKHAEFLNGEKISDYIISKPSYGMLACERSEYCNSKALNNNETKVCYFIPFFPETETPDWLHAQHLGTHLYFAETEDVCMKILINKVKESMEVHQSAMNELTGLLANT